MWKSVVQPDRPQVTIWRIRIAFWIPKAINTHLEHVIVIAFPLRKWLHERASMLLYTYIGCLVKLLASFKKKNLVFIVPYQVNVFLIWGMSLKKPFPIVIRN